MKNKYKNKFLKIKGFTPSEIARPKGPSGAQARARFQTGFTLVELLVSMSVFLILLVVAIGIFVNGLRDQRHLTDLMAVNNNVGIVLEQMAREIRTGYNFEVSGDCETLEFVNGQKTTEGDESYTTYTLSGGTINRNEDGGISGPLTSSNVLVKNLCFSLEQHGTASIIKDCNPWRITILMEVETRNSGSNAKKSYIQTTVSSRVLPIEIEGDPYQCKDI